MKIDHAALYTADLERSRAFYEKYFDGTASKQCHYLSSTPVNYTLLLLPANTAPLLMLPTLLGPQELAHVAGLLALFVY